MPKYLFNEPSESEAKDQLLWQQVMSLRDSDFDTNSAFAEIIDNSTQANLKDGSITTKNIKIYINSKIVGSGTRYSKEVVDSATFIDDGTGMNKEILGECLLFSNSSRYNDRSGIGRFGVGMTYAAIFQSRKCEVYSKTIEGSWMYIVYDLTGNPDKDPAPMISDPLEKEPPKEYLNKLESSEHGTIVILSHFDKITENYQRVVDELIYYLGRTYRHFIWGSTSRFENIKNSINFNINDKKVFAIDPLYLTKVETEFPDDPVAEPWDVEPVAVPTDENSELETSVEVRMSLLPKEWRKIKGRQTPTKISRHVNGNTGISIIRKGREVADFIPNYLWGKTGFGGGNKGWDFEMNQWWGCEISFDPACDSQFQVKNIKRGAKPTLELREQLASRLRNRVATMTEKIRQVWDENDDNKPKPGKGGGSKTQDIIDKDPIKTNPQYNPEKIIEEKYKAHNYQVEHEDWSGDDFADYVHKDKGLTLVYNTRHELYKKIYELQQIVLDEDSSKGELIDAAENFNTIIELLIWSYGKIQTDYDREQEITTEDLFEGLDNSWGRLLKNYIKKLENMEDKQRDTSE